MNTNHYRNALRYLDVRLPHGLWPGLHADGTLENVGESRETHESYGWNPPEYCKVVSTYASFDEQADVKPSWQAIEQADSVLSTRASTDVLRKGFKSFGYDLDSHLSTVGIDGGSEETLEYRVWFFFPWDGDKPIPSWDQVLSAGKSDLLADHRKTALTRLEFEEKRRISGAYLEGQRVDVNIENEILYRLRATSEVLALKDAERDRLHGKAVALETWIMSSTRTLDELESVDPTDDQHWQEI